MKTTYLILSILLAMSACSSSQEKPDKVQKQGISYDYEVSYSYQDGLNIKEDKYREFFSNDTLYIFLEEFFSNDRIEIKKDNSIILDVTINTDSSTGLAEVLKIGNIQSLKQLMIRMNGGTWINFEIRNNTQNLIGVRNEKRKIHILYYKIVPIFD